MNNKVRKLLLCGLFLLFINVSIALHIKSLSVPASYEIKDDTEPLILNCDYEVNETDTGFVLKWLHNNIAIYQWIPTKHPFSLGSFKGRVDKNFTTSDERLKKHSALVITKPLLSDSGNYTCSVQTFQGADKKSADIQMIDPEDSIKLSYKFESDETVKVQCNVHNIYPVPEVNFLLDDKEIDSVDEKEIQLENELFNVTVTTALNKTEIKDESPLTCVVKIPNTDYMKKETIAYDDPKKSATTKTSVLGLTKLEQSDADTNNENNASGFILSPTAMSSSLLLLVILSFVRS